MGRVWFWRRALGLSTGALVLLASCGPVTDRPLRGASPGAPLDPTSALPPTLSPTDPRLAASAAPSASAVLATNASPAPSVSPLPTLSGPVAAPIIRTLVPGANTTTPSSGLIVSAVLIGRGTDLVEATLAVDGVPVDAQIDMVDARQWTIHFAPVLDAGAHSAKVTVKDATGTSAGFTWNFSSGGLPAQIPAPAASPASQ